MATIRLPADFRDFLRLLNSHRVEYLATLDGIPVTIIGLADLIKNKLKSGRLKDLDDARRLS
jgi:hypothetical protein